MSDVEQVPDEEVKADNEKTVKTTFKGYDYLSVALKVIFSTPGLVILVILYSIMGAFIFPLLEAPREIRNSVAIAKSREECLKELWTITEKLNVLYEKNWTMLVHEQLRRFEGSIVAATRNGLGGSELDRSTRWSFSEALLYSVTVITTIGHGNLTPKTSEGKVVTILYALIGVPLMLMCLSSLGGLLAEALQCTYSRISCSTRSRRKNNPNSCIGQSHEMDCNVCKYDAMSSETKLHGYDYSAVNEREDSCNLIRSSPSKMNHSSACMQLRTHPTIQQYTIKSDTSPIKRGTQSQPHSPQHYQITQNTYCRTGGGGCLNPGVEGIPEATGTATVYFPVTSSGNHYSCSSTIHFNQPTVKYQGIQLQHQLANTKTFDPHTHTATVHGIRRGKFLPKPMPQEINMLLAESDISYRHDGGSGSPEMGKGSSGSVDIMEDEEENEQNRTGCPHGTPSRIPLISSSSSSGKMKDNGMEIEADRTGSGGEEGDNNGTQENSTPQVPITIVLLILVSYILLGTVIFAFWEDWSFIDGAYFCFVTLSTIGYGDFLPQQTFRGPDVQLFACCAYLLLGLVLVAMAFSLLETQLMWKCKRIAVRLKLARD